MARAAVGLVAVLTAALFSLSLVLVPEDRAEVLVAGLTAVAAATVGALIVVRMPGNRVGWLFLAIGLVPAAHIGSRTEARRSMADGTGDQHTALVGWLASWTIPAWLLLVLVVLPLTFPDGRLPSRRWRPVGWLTWGLAALVLIQALNPGPLDLYDGGTFPVDNPLGVGLVSGVAAGTGGIFFSGLLLLSVVAVASLFVRYRRASHEVRQQLRWVLVSLAVAAVALALDEVPPPGSVAGGVSAITSALVALALAAVPVAAGVAVLRYRLYDLDVVINRVAVHGGLVVGVTLFYLAAVTGAGAVLDDATAGPVGLVVAAVVALLLQPVRARLERRINLLTFGFRSSPADAVSALSQVRASSTPERLLASAAEQVAHALRMEHARIDALTEAGPVPVAEFGVAPPVESSVVPVLRRGEEVGRLVVTSRSRRLTSSDAAVLEVLCREVGECLEVVRLGEAIRQSRADLVTAREEERRRLRRDLHDGLGSALTGMILKLQAAGAVESPAAAAIAGDVEQDARTALEDVRRLLYGLRPPSLDERGLAGALRDEVDRLDEVLPAAVELEVESLPDALPAAVEVAAYRIVLEALSNVARHADARYCRVRLHLDGALQVVVHDDGVGLPSTWCPGIGLASIRERTEELGGTWQFEQASPQGTRLTVRLPVAS